MPLHCANKNRGSERVSDLPQGPSVRKWQDLKPIFLDLASIPSTPLKVLPLEGRPAGRKLERSKEEDRKART